MKITNLILSGGPAHDYPRTSEMVSELLGEVGIESEVTADLGALERAPLPYELVTVNCCRSRCEEVPAWREEWGFEVSRRARENLLDLLNRGKGLLALHAATLCFDDWPEYRQILGAWWEWGYSGHPPVQEHRMRVRTGAHPIVEGITDFRIVDELYLNLRFAEPVEAFIEGEWEGKAHPILWTREFGGARVCYNALGHGPEAFENEANRRLLQRGALWVARRLGSE
jgi:hypothetical protein